MNYDEQRLHWDALNDEERHAALYRAKEALRSIFPRMALVVEELQCLAYKRGYQDAQDEMLLHERGGEA